MLTYSQLQSYNETDFWIIVNMEVIFSAGYGKSTKGKPGGSQEHVCLWGVPWRLPGCSSHWSIPSKFCFEITLCVCVLGCVCVCAGLCVCVCVCVLGCVCVCWAVCVCVCVCVCCVCLCAVCVCVCDI